MDFNVWGVLRISRSNPICVIILFKYKKETGRGIEDYVKLQKDFSSMNPDNLLREYLTITEGEGLVYSILVLKGVNVGETHL